MRSVAFWAVFICLGVYFGVGFAGVYTWGFDTKDNILYNYNPLFKDSFDVTIAFIGNSSFRSTQSCDLIVLGLLFQEWPSLLWLHILYAFFPRDSDWNLRYWLVFPFHIESDIEYQVLYPSRFDSDDSGRASRAVVILLTAMTVGRWSIFPQRVLQLGSSVPWLCHIGAVNGTGV